MTNLELCSGHSLRPAAAAWCQPERI